MSEERETSPETQAELDETTFRRADALGRGCVVAGFSVTGKAMAFDVELREGELTLVPLGTIPITPTPSPKRDDRPGS